MCLISNTMKYVGALLLTLVSSSVVLIIAKCQGPSAGIGLCLASSQIQRINDNTTLISDIKENYFRNQSFYSTLPAIVELSETQKTDILDRYPEFFSAESQAVLEKFVYNGTVHNASASGRRKRQVSADYVCPAIEEYKDILFSFSATGNLLQMVQFSNQSVQWILQETCYSAQGSVPDTICVGRQRTVKAVALNLDDPEAEIALHDIIVTSCAAKEV